MDHLRSTVVCRVLCFAESCVPICDSCPLLHIVLDSHDVMKTINTQSRLHAHVCAKTLTHCSQSFGWTVLVFDIASLSSWWNEGASEARSLIRSARHSAKAMPAMTGEPKGEPTLESASLINAFLPDTGLCYLSRALRRNWLTQEKQDSCRSSEPSWMRMTLLRTCYYIDWSHFR